MKLGTKCRVWSRESEHLKQQPRARQRQEGQTRVVVDVYRARCKRVHCRRHENAWNTSRQSNPNLLFWDKRIGRSVTWLFVLPRVCHTIDHFSTLTNDACKRPFNFEDKQEDYIRH